MITLGLQLVLLLFGSVGFGGAGASMAVARARRLEDHEQDVGMLGVALLLGSFGALCTALATGMAGIFAFGGVVTWLSYVLMSQHLGAFRIEVPGRSLASTEASTEETRRPF
ncbi:MAG TPA: hypothetical protein VMK65_01645 [Longimicrobiales bacterium]|nr:hypothetical protein [Longimicrobiales bacterium]